jgi:hypothetical protein
MPGQQCSPKEAKYQIIRQFISNSDFYMSRAILICYLRQSLIVGRLDFRNAASCPPLYPVACRTLNVSSSPEFEQLKQNHRSETICLVPVLVGSSSDSRHYGEGKFDYMQRSIQYNGFFLLDCLRATDYLNSWPEDELRCVKRGGSFPNV